MFFQKYFAVHEQLDVKNSFSTYVCYAPDGLFWLNLYSKILYPIRHRTFLLRKISFFHSFCFERPLTPLGVNNVPTRFFFRMMKNCHFRSLESHFFAVVKQQKKVRTQGFRKKARFCRVIY